MKHWRREAQRTTPVAPDIGFLRSTLKVAGAPFEIVALAVTVRVPLPCTHVPVPANEPPVTTMLASLSEPLPERPPTMRTSPLPMSRPEEGSTVKVSVDSSSGTELVAVALAVVNEATAKDTSGAREQV
jgi:hypothetical protein